jgi:hypothetical protein
VKTRRITKEDVIREMRAVVDEYGADYLYESPCDSNTCVYAWKVDGKITPSCIVGQVLHRLGLPDDVLNELDGACWSVIIQLREDHGWDFDSDASLALTTAQQIQDKAVSDPGEGDWTWGAALRAAEENAE